MINRRNRTRGAGLVFSFEIAAIAFVIFGFQGTSAALAQSGHQQGRNLPESAKAAQVRALNNGLLQLHGQIQEGSPSDESGIRSQAAPVIAERAAALKSLIEENPRAALSFAFSPELLADLAAKFPQSASLLEANVMVSGQFEHWIQDSADLKTSRTYFRMKVETQTLNLYFAGPEPNLKPGELLKATGVVLGSDMAVLSTTSVQGNGSSAAPAMLRSSPTAANPALGLRWSMSASLTLVIVIVLFAVIGLAADVRKFRGRILVACKQCGVYAVALGLIVFSPTASYAQSACSTTGVQNIAVLLVTFPGVTLPTGVTQASLQDVFFAANTPGVSLDGFLQDASYGQTSATGSVFGPYTLTGTYQSCTDVGGAVTNDAVAAAIAAGVNFNNYSRVFLVFPDIFGCGWAGFASVGGCTLATTSGTFNATISWLSAAYTTPRWQGVAFASHETGHNLGLLHSGLLTPAVATDVIGPVSSPGTESDLGDYWSTMGQVELGLYPAPQKAETLGWMAPSTNYQVLQSSGTYTLQPLQTDPAGLQALKVERGSGSNEWLWIEYRQPVGNYDSTLITQPYSGALIHYEDANTPSGHTYLPNFTPSDTSGYSSALAAGETWTDSYSNVSISVLSATSSGLSVSVSYGAMPCTSSSPSVSVSPLNPSIYPGQSASYSVSVTNNDSAGCSSSTISLDSSAPSGWSTGLSSSSVTLSPGQSASVTMGKGAPSGTPPGTYAVNLSAANISASASGTANATVMTPPTFAANISVSGTSFTPPGAVPITASVTNGGAPTSGASVKFTLTTPSGGATTQTSTTGSNGSATWNYKLNSRSAAGTYSVVAQAALISGSKKAPSAQSTTSNTATFSVQ